MRDTMPAVVELLASVTGSTAEDWEVIMDGPDSGVGVDFWFRNQKSGAEAYINLDQDHLTISVDEEKIYDGCVRPSHKRRSRHSV
ncbi:MAG: hypothetical protein E6L09_08645 [Verrucomicrobia bacterium]|nr:MAG: hypothetical protein E6L09_08645 [Verrucomicrobiota bacterium]